MKRLPGFSVCLRDVDRMIIQDIPAPIPYTPAIPSGAATQARAWGSGNQQR